MLDTARSPEIQQCIRECSTCHDICLETLTHCLAQGGPHVEPEHLALQLDCAEICQTSANFMLRASSVHTETCRACAAVCARCAESCEQITGDDAMSRCAKACRRCAESCRRMSSAAK
jgi:hypothetical protein